MDLGILFGDEWDYELLDTITPFSGLEYLTLPFEALVGGWDQDFEDEDEFDLLSSIGETGHRDVANKLYIMNRPEGVLDQVQSRKAV